MGRKITKSHSVRELTKKVSSSELNEPASRELYSLIRGGLEKSEADASTFDETRSVVMRG